MDKYFCDFQTIIRNEYIINCKDTDSILLNPTSICAFCWFCTFRWLLAPLVSDPSVWSLIGEPFHYTGDRKVFNLVLFGISTFGTLFRTIFLIGKLTCSIIFDKFRIISAEKSGELEIIKNIVELKDTSKHELSQENAKQLFYVSKLVNILVFKIMRFIPILVFGSVYGAFIIIAYIQQDFEFSIVASILWFIVLTIWSRYITSSIIFSYGIIFFTAFYIKLRFKQLKTNLLMVFNGRSAYLKEFLRMHNKLSVLTHEFNKIFCYILAINQFISTFTLSLLFFVTFYGRGPVVFRLANLLIATSQSVFLVTF